MYNNKKKLPKYQDSNFFNRDNPWGIIEQGVNNPYTQQQYMIDSPYNLPQDNINPSDPSIAIPPPAQYYSWAEDPDNFLNPYNNIQPDITETPNRRERTVGTNYVPNLVDPRTANEHAWNMGAFGATARGINQGTIDAGRGYGVATGVGAGLSAVGFLGSGIKSALQRAGVQKSFQESERARAQELRRNQTQDFTDEKGIYTQRAMRSDVNVRQDGGMLFNNNPYLMQDGGALESIVANDITAEPLNPNTNVEVEKGEIVIDPNTNDVRLVQGQTHQQTDEYKGVEYSGVPTEFQGGEMVISNNGKVDKKTAKEFGVPTAKTYAELVTKHPIQKEINKITEKITEWAEKSEKYLEETEDQAKATTNSRNLEFISGKINELEQELSPLKEEILALSMSVYEIQEQAKTNGTYEGIKPPIEEQGLMQEGGEIEVIAQEVASMLQQGADPQEVLNQLIEGGIPPEEAEQLVMMVMQQLQGQQEQPMGMMQNGGRPLIDMYDTPRVIPEGYGYRMAYPGGMEAFGRLNPQAQTAALDYTKGLLNENIYKTLRQQAPSDAPISTTQPLSRRQQLQVDKPPVVDFTPTNKKKYRTDPNTGLPIFQDGNTLSLYNTMGEQFNMELSPLDKTQRKDYLKKHPEFSNFYKQVKGQPLYIHSGRFENPTTGESNFTTYISPIKENFYPDKSTPYFIPSERNMSVVNFIEGESRERLLKEGLNKPFQEGGGQDPTMQLLMTYAEMSGMTEQDFQQMISELQQLPPEQVEQFLMQIQDEMGTQEQGMFTQNPYMQNGGRGGVRRTRVENPLVPSIQTVTGSYNFPATIEDGENVVGADLTNVEKIQSSVGAGLYGKQVVPLDEAKKVHSWYFDNKKDFDLTKPEDVKDFQKAYNKEVEKRALDAGLSKEEAKEQVKKYGFTDSDQGVNQVDGKWGAFTSTRPLPNFKKTKTDDGTVIDVVDDITGENITTPFVAGDWSPSTRRGSSNIPTLGYVPDIMTGVRTPSLLRSQRQELTPVKISPEQQIRENQRNAAIFGEIVGQNIGVPDNFSRQIADSNQQAFVQSNQYNAQQVAQTDQANAQLAMQNELQNQRNLDTYQTRALQAEDNTLAQVNQARREARNWQIGQRRDQMAFAATQAAYPDMDFGYNPLTGNYDVHFVGQRTPYAPRTVVEKDLLKESDITKEQDGGKPIKKKFKFKPKKK